MLFEFFWIAGWEPKRMPDVESFKHGQDLAGKFWAAALVFLAFLYAGKIPGGGENPPSAFYYTGEYILSRTYGPAVFCFGMDPDVLHTEKEGIMRIVGGAPGKLISA